MGMTGLADLYATRAGPGSRATGPARPGSAASPANLEFDRQLAGVQAAKDFESVLLEQMMQSMRETVGEGGLLDEDEGSSQIQDMFWGFLSQDVANKGGMGLWKDIYRQIVGGEPPSAGPGRLELLK
jgi:Rod binding domain-containing protein